MQALEGHSLERRSFGRRDGLALWAKVCAALCEPDAHNGSSTPQARHPCTTVDFDVLQIAALFVVEAAMASERRSAVLNAGLQRSLDALM